MADWYVDFGIQRVADEYIDVWARYIDDRAWGIVEAATRGQAKAKFLRTHREYGLEYTDRAFVRRIKVEKVFYDSEYYDAAPDWVLNAADDFFGIER